jgi:hypothetical protein
VVISPLIQSVSVPAVTPVEPQRKRKKMEKNEKLLSFEEDSASTGKDQNRVNIFSSLIVDE